MATPEILELGIGAGPQKSTDIKKDSLDFALKNTLYTQKSRPFSASKQTLGKS
jgi:hypothetical protein